ncbi:MAG TPA: translation initiation factor 2 [Candidatus Desulfovibrio gallistercoris]|nr:translation initiation factor 2 [Candidatus Desulfovibrio gallistercoris]
MQTFAREVITRAALAAGLPEGRVIDMVKKDNLTLQRPRMELQFLPEKYTRTGRTLGLARHRRTGSAAAAQRSEPETAFSGEAIASAPQDAGPSVMVLTRTRELYEVVQTVNANVLADDRPWLEAFSHAFAAALPRGGNDSRGNWVRVRAQQATFGRSPDKRVGDQVIEVFTRVERLFVISFTWRITGKEEEVLIPTFTIKPKLG